MDRYRSSYRRRLQTRSLLPRRRFFRGTIDSLEVLFDNESGFLSRLSHTIHSDITRGGKGTSWLNPKTSAGANRLEPALTLSEISQQTGISMPTLQRYKKIYQGRIPSEGRGASSVIPRARCRSSMRSRTRTPASGAVRARILRRRVRSVRRPASAVRAVPPSSAAKAGRQALPRPARPPPRRRPAAAGHRGPPLAAAPGRPPRPPRRQGPSGARAEAVPGHAEIRQSVDAHPDQRDDRDFLSHAGPLRAHARRRLPSEGKGRARRFYPQAVDVFRQLRSESGRGGRKKGSGAAKAVPPRGRGRAAAASTS